MDAARGYCNFTYMQEDAYVAAGVAQKKVKENLVVAADQATKAARQASKAARQLSDKAAVAATPHLKRTRAIYEESVKPHVDKHVTPVVAPVYNQHLVPVLEKAALYQKEALTHLKEGTSKLHKGLVKRFEKDCPVSRRRLKEMDAPAFIMDHMNEACSKPEKTVNRYLLTILVIFVLIFRSFLWRTFWRLFLLPFRIVWFFSPLRFFFPKKTTADAESVTPDTVSR